jgi:Arc/MetJ-type ribon-helix-helix transcriptional regulator
MSDETSRAVADALDSVAAGQQRTRPVSVSIPEPLIDAVQRLVADGAVGSTSSAMTSALAAWLRNQVLHAQLEEVFAEHPDLRPTEDGIAQTLTELGLRRADEVA